MKRVGAKVLLFLGCLLTASAWAQQAPPASDAESEILRVTTRMVVVDVVAHDASGKPVTSLTKNDFTVLENGKPQTIATFAVRNASAPVSRRLAPLLQPHVTTNRPDLHDPDEPAVVLLLDGLNTSGRDLTRVRQQMLKYLAEHFNPNVKMAVMVLTSELHVLQDFTSDPALLKAALDRYRAQQSASARAKAEAGPLNDLPPPSALPLQSANIVQNTTLDPAVANSAGGSSATVAEQLAYLEERFANEVENYSRDTRISTTLAVLSQIARYMAGQKGRKSILWFSAAFPISVTGFDAADLSTSRIYDEQVRRTMNLLSDAHVAIYTIDARGLVGNKVGDVTPAYATGGMVGPEMNKALAKDSYQRFQEENLLQDVALDTGGQYFADNDLDRAIAESVRDTANYYIIGYYPANKKWDGTFRRIQVKVNRPGVHVEHRRGYFATDPFDWRKNGGEKVLTAAVGSDSLISTQVLFFARALPPAAHNDVNVEFLVDPNTISFETESENREYCSLQFEVQAFSKEGKLVRAEVQSAEAPLKAATYDRVRKQGIPMSVPIKLPPGDYTLKLGVRDNRTGLFGTAELPIQIAK